MNLELIGLLSIGGLVVLLWGWLMLHGPPRLPKFEQARGERDRIELARIHDARDAAASFEDWIERCRRAEQALTNVQAERDAALDRVRSLESGRELAQLRAEFTATVAERDADISFLREQQIVAVDALERAAAKARPLAYLRERIQEALDALQQRREKRKP